MAATESLASGAKAKASAHTRPGICTRQLTTFPEVGELLQALQQSVGRRPKRRAGIQLLAKQIDVHALYEVSPQDA